MPGFGEVDDGEAAEAEGEPAVNVQPGSGIVRAAMHQLVAHDRHQVPGGSFVSETAPAEIPNDSTHYYIMYTIFGTVIGSAAKKKTRRYIRLLPVNP
jgi:hypothetical protein